MESPAIFLMLLASSFVLYILFQDELSSNELVVEKIPEILQRRWSKQTLIAFLHIGKTGGTSIDATVEPIVRFLSKAPYRRGYLGRIHFDWSYLKKAFYGYDVDVITMLRHPVDRAISQYYFHKSLPRQQTDYDFLNSTVESFFSNWTMMMDHRTIWQDGQGAVAWFTGTQTGHVVHHSADILKDNHPSLWAIERDKRELMLLNSTWACHLAADRLEETLWFGILEKLDESMEQLSRALGWGKIKMAHKRPTVHKGGASEELKKKIAVLMPMDIWLYDYALDLFNARKNDLMQPKRPPLPQIRCRATSKIFACDLGTGFPTKVLKGKPTKKYLEKFQKIVDTNSTDA